MKIQISQISTLPGSIEKNTEKIIQSIKLAKKNKVDLVVFPELTIPGYMSMDLLLYKEFIDENKKALEIIARSTIGITAIVGFVDNDPEIIGPDGTPIRYNSAGILQNGRIIGIEDKTLLPTYDVFYETRYFAPCRGVKLYECAGEKLGIEVCEDLWTDGYKEDVTAELVRKGADILINISASPFYTDKLQVRKKLIEKVVAKYKKPFVYTNLVGSQDGFEGQLVFDGQSLVLDKDGKIIGLGEAFKEDRVLVDLDRPQKVTLPQTSTEEQHYQALVLGIKDYFEQARMQKAFIGLSGGIDSALVASLATAALGKENVTGVSMPSSVSSEGSLTDARTLAENLGIGFMVIPIEGTREALQQRLNESLGENPEDLTNQNIQARIRGMVLMALANEYRGLVISTGNKTELALGYCTLYGDMAGGLAAISDLDKLKVYALARYINQQESREVIPRKTIEKAPSAELTKNQTDEKSLGADYPMIVPIVNRIVEEKATIAELSKEYPNDLVEKYWNLVSRNEFKRRQAAPGIKVTPKAFGVGRRIPMNHEFKK